MPFTKKPVLLIDFDSTFVSVEGLDELAKICLRNCDGSKNKIAELEAITRAGMAGEIGFAQSLEKRLSLFQPRKDDLNELIVLLRASVSSSITRQREFLLRYADNVYIISGGFKDYIWPVVKDFGIKRENIYANQFIYDSAGKNVVGYDQQSMLAQDGGKVKQATALQLNSEVLAVGDGFSDYELRSSGLAAKFFAYAENIERPGILELADEVVYSFDQLVSYLERI